MTTDSIPNRGCPILAHPLRKGGIPRSLTSRYSDSPSIGPGFRLAGAGCPILARPLRKGGIPLPSAPWSFILPRPILILKARGFSRSLALRLTFRPCGVQR